MDELPRIALAAERIDLMARAVRELRDALASAQAERDAARAELATALLDVEALRERLKGIEDRTIAAVRETLWGPPR